MGGGDDAGRTGRGAVTRVNQTVIGVGVINHADALFLPNSVGDLEDIVDNIQVFLVKSG